MPKRKQGKQTHHAHIISQPCELRIWARIPQPPRPPTQAGFFHGLESKRCSEVMLFQNRPKSLVMTALQEEDRKIPLRQSDLWQPWQKAPELLDLMIPHVQPVVENAQHPCGHRRPDAVCELQAVGPVACQHLRFNQGKPHRPTGPLVLRKSRLPTGHHCCNLGGTGHT